MFRGVAKSFSTLKATRGNRVVGAVGVGSQQPVMAKKNPTWKTSCC